MSTFGDQICFFFIVSIKKKLQQENEPRPKCTSKTTASDMFFRSLLSPRATDPSNNQPPTNKHQPKDLRNCWKFKILDSRNIFILHNTAGKTYYYNLVSYPKNLLVCMNLIRRSQLYLFLWFLNFNTLLLRRYFKVTFFSWILLQFIV